ARIDAADESPSRASRAGRRTFWGSRNPAQGTKGGGVMEPRHVEFRKGRLGIEKLEPRIAPTILMVNGGGNTPNGEASTMPRDQAGEYIFTRDAKSSGM